MRAVVLLASFLQLGGAFQLAASGSPASGVRASAPQMSQLRHPAAGALATTLALAISTASPVITPAVQPPAVVQQYGGSMIADDVSDAQAKFLEERKMRATEYEKQVESSFKMEEETEDKKDTYKAVVSGLVLIAFIAPMVTFFYYTGGE